MTKLTWMCAVAAALVTGSGVAQAQLKELYAADPAVRRQALVEVAAQRGREALPHLGSALYDEDRIVRRTAARLLLRMGESADDVLKAAMNNIDAQVRRIALLGLRSIDALTMDDLALALEDEEELLRLETVRILVAMAPGNERIEVLLRRAAGDDSFLVREEALKSIASSGRRPTLREQHMDRLIETVDSFKLPAEGWRFRTDDASAPSGQWHQPDYDDSDWAVTEIEKPWTPGYVGVGWYRGWFEMPPKSEINCDGVEIHFDGVDESAWVWINGRFAGSHDIGPSGWDVPFALDITDLVNWDSRNQITVRAMNTGYAGGIWQPVTVNFLKVK